ncbi:MAG: septation protein A [Rhodospirillaceae bacterium]|nr:MAG: septation protein A [Rhodospirillaceae bacterium]
MNQGLKLLLEAGPLVVFFIVNAKMGIFTATAVFMVVTILSLGYSYFKLKRLPTLPLIGGAFIMVFGGLTIVLEDDTFIKLKPTIVNTLFSAALFTGLAIKKNFLKTALESAMSLDDEGWRILAWRWAFFFLLLAVMNEIVWRTQTTDMWVNFKVFGVMPLTLVFSLTQVPLIMRHGLDDEDEKEANDPKEPKQENA